MGLHETQAGSTIARAINGYLGLVTGNRRHATATITFVNGALLNRHDIICYPKDLWPGQQRWVEINRWVVCPRAELRGERQRKKRGEAGVWSLTHICGPWSSHFYLILWAEWGIGRSNTFCSDKVSLQDSSSTDASGFGLYFLFIELHKNRSWLHHPRTQSKRPSTSASMVWQSPYACWIRR